MSDLIGNVTNRTATLRDEYRFVVEMWAAYRFACSDTPSPEKLDRMLALCDDRTTDLVKRYGLAFSEDVLFGERKIASESDALLAQLRRSATVCPKDGCMLWKGHEEDHATAEQVSEALAANSHGRRR